MCRSRLSDYHRNFSPLTPVDSVTLDRVAHGRPHACRLAAARRILGFARLSLEDGVSTIREHEFPKALPAKRVGHVREEAWRPHILILLERRVQFQSHQPHHEIEDAVADVAGWHTRAEATRLSQHTWLVAVLHGMPSRSAVSKMKASADVGTTLQRRRLFDLAAATQKLPCHVVEQTNELLRNSELALDSHDFFPIASRRVVVRMYCNSASVGLARLCASVREGHLEERQTRLKSPQNSSAHSAKTTCSLRHEAMPPRSS